MTNIELGNEYGDSLNWTGWPLCFSERSFEEFIVAFKEKCIAQVEDCLNAEDAIESIRNMK